MAIKQDNSFRCWLWFASNRQEELYEVISAMIKDKVEELLPQMVEELLRQKIDNLSFNIQTTINGKSSASFKDIITDMIIKEFQ
jgi:uncharacterized protein (DUF111 family)